MMIYLLFIAVFVQAQRDDLCSNGNCIPINECSEALENYYKGNRLDVCWMNRFMPIVCCNNQNAIGYKSQQMCDKWFKMKPKNRFFNAEAFELLGGIGTSENEFPHMAALGYRNEDVTEWACGGSLISEKYILTAAHCLNSKELGAVKIIRLGSINLKQSRSDNENIQEIGVKRRIKHPQYKPPSQYHDIALIELNDAVTFTDFVKPACLHVEKFVYDYNWIASGWGHVEIGGPPSDHLQKIYLQESSYYECRNAYADVSRRKLQYGIVDDFQVCAYGENQEDTCQGDSGGPLQIRNANRDAGYTVIGITSFGKACGVLNTPGVYTRVSNYVSWIEDVVFT